MLDNKKFSDPLFKITEAYSGAVIVQGELPAGILPYGTLAFQHYADTGAEIGVTR